MTDSFLTPFSRPSFLVGMLALVTVTLIVFRVAPGLDIAASRAFFDLSDCPPATLDTASCGHFATGADPVMKVFRQVMQVLPALAAAAILGWAGYRHWRRSDLDRRALAEMGVAFGALVLSPLLLVNGIFKSYWGRPRPHMVDLFGGELPFVPAGTITSYCESNCSFISGEAAGAFWLVCLVPLVPREDRLPVLVGTLAIAVSASLLRVAFGGHFLSDVMLGGMATVTTFSLLAVLAARWLRTAR